MVVKASSSELEIKDPLSPTQLIALSFARAVVPLSIRDRYETPMVQDKKTKRERTKVSL